VAKTAPAREGLKDQFARHDIERAYLALTLGVPRTGRIETWHARHPTARLKFTSNVDSGKRAVTDVVVLEAFRTRAALVRCTLETGRTHQIRVHLSERCRTPLLGDALYGRRVPELGLGLERQALHAAVLGFRHPLTAQALRFESALPADFSLALETLRAGHA
jgi:23S rRNA pseudouridine1911/1915/1917 synthase